MKIHIVQKGDTMWSIAKKYKVSFDELKALNGHIREPELTVPGMKIKIPGASKPAAKQPAEVRGEQSQQQAVPPYLDQSVKPMPVIQEDEQEMMSYPSMPQMPQAPQMPMYQPEMDNDDSDDYQGGQGYYFPPANQAIQQPVQGINPHMHMANPNWQQGAGMTPYAQMQQPYPAMQETAPMYGQYGMPQTPMSGHSNMASPMYQQGQQMPQMQQGSPGMEMQMPQIQQGAPGMEMQNPQMWQGAPGMEMQMPQMQQGAPGMEMQMPQMQQGAPGMEMQNPQMWQETPGMQMQQGNPVMGMQSPQNTPMYQEDLPYPSYQMQQPMGYHTQPSYLQQNPTAGYSQLPAHQEGMQGNLKKSGCFGPPQQFRYEVHPPQQGASFTPYPDYYGVEAANEADFYEPSPASDLPGEDNK